MNSERTVHPDQGASAHGLDLSGCTPSILPFISFAFSVEWEKALARESGDPGPRSQLLSVPEHAAEGTLGTAALLSAEQKGEESSSGLVAGKQKGQEGLRGSGVGAVVPA